MFEICKAAVKAALLYGYT